jgi:dipeptidyl aminopeptidase/acylaminoacyl peptidase
MGSHYRTWSIAVLLIINTGVVFAQVGLEKVLKQKRHKPVCTAFSTDSRHLATGSTNSDIFIWSLASNTVFKKLEGLSNFPISLVFSSNNEYLVSGGKDHNVTLWHVQTGLRKRTLAGHEDNVLSVDISPDDKWIVSGSIDKTIRIWELETGINQKVLQGHKHQVNSVCYNFDGTKILSASADRTIIEWDAKTGEKIRMLTGGHNDWIRKAMYSPDGKYIVSCGDDNMITIWNNNSGEISNTILAHKDNVFSFSFSPDGKYLVSGGHDKRIIVIEVETGKIAFQSTEQENYIVSVSFAPDGKHFASAVLYSDILRIWNVEDLHISYEEIAKAEVTRDVIQKPKSKPEIISKTPTGSVIQSSSSIYPLEVAFKSEASISKIDVLINDKHFSSFGPDELKAGENDQEVLSRNLFLSKGENHIKIALQTDDGQIASNTFTVNYKAPKKAKLSWNAGLSSQMETNNQIITLSNHVSSITNLKSATLLHNEHVIYNQEDIVVSPDSNLWHFSRPIALHEGENRLKLMVTNEGGVSESEVLVINYNPQKTQLDVVIPPAKPNPYRFALIIGNEDYSSYQVGLESESDVDFAKNDAQEFHKLAIKYLGVPEDQAILKLNCRYIEMKREIKKMKGIIELTNGKAEVFFYYAGHGFPDDKTKEPYLIPVDGNGMDLEFSAIRLKDIYNDLTAFPSARVTVFLDACFSGGGRNKGILEARGVKVKPKEANVKEKMVVFSAASENQTSLPYKEKEHGMFTYFLNKKISETGGIVTYKELSEYVSEQVGIKSYLINSKKQIPETNASPEINGLWQAWRLR